jgi:hypothetical protein
VSQRDYNHVYIAGPFILQIMQDSQHDGIVIGLTPAITLAINNGRSIVALGFAWIVGTVNVAIMTKQFREAEKNRIQQVKEHAEKAGITFKQQELRWGW